MVPEPVLSAASTLDRHGLVTAFGHISLRCGPNSYAITPPRPLGWLQAGDDMVEVELEDQALPPGAPGEAWIHAAIYRARPDVSAVVRAQPPSSHPVGALTDAVAPVHGQGGWLGSAIPIHGDATLVRTAEAGRAVAATLGGGAAVILRGNGAVAVAASPAEAVTRQWVLEQACAHWLRAAAGGTIRPLEESEVAAWGATWGELWPRLWAYLEYRR